MFRVVTKRKGNTLSKRACEGIEGKKRTAHAQHERRVRESWRAKRYSFSSPVLFVRCGRRGSGNVTASKLVGCHVSFVPRQNSQFRDTSNRNNDF